MRHGASRFLFTTLLVGAAVVAGGWWTGARATLHGLLLALASAAFLPFLVAAIALAVVLLALLVAARKTRGDRGAAGGGPGAPLPRLSTNTARPDSYHGLIPSPDPVLASERERKTCASPAVWQSP